ncbi:MAG TPA: T9SS type A sorting domain-containing protein, partial [Taishania sp.]|nr:T9SS type A sorting domain-containing protein [Taishania sp.]
QAYIHSIIDDTSIVAINDSLIKYLELCRGLEFQKQLLNVYSTTQNQHKFDSLIVKLPISRDLMSYYRVIYDLNKYNDWSVAVQEDTTIIARLNNLRHSSDPEVENITSMLVSTLEKQPVSLIVMPLSSSSRSLITSMPTEENILNEESENILLYPNPAKDELFIKFINKSDAKETIVRFYDLTGKEVLKTQVNEQQNSIINLNGLNKGIYLVKLFSDGQLQETHKLVIQ